MKLRSNDESREFGPLVRAVLLGLAASWVSTAIAQIDPNTRSEGSRIALVGSRICAEWAAPEEAGHVDGKVVDESSGLALSRKFSRLYHVNDSGAKAEYYETALDGSGTRVVSIAAPKPKDVEEIAVGPCPSSELTCVLLADIGDNMVNRKHVELTFVAEVERATGKLPVLSKVKLAYPDGAHDAEAAAILPNGDVVVVTKEGGLVSSAKPAMVFRVRRAAVARPTKEPVVLEKLGTIDVPSLVGATDLEGLVTAMSVSKDGSRFVLLTYGKALEFQIELAKSEPANWRATADLVRGVDYSLVQLKKLHQQEAIVYDLDDRSLLYLSEVRRRLFGSRAPEPMMRVRCQR